MDFNLYMEIVYFLHSGGGPYEVMNGDVQENLIDALYYGRYFLQRGECGEIVTFCDYWLIHPEDLESVRDYCRPADVNTGSIIVIVDHVNKGGRRSLVNMMKGVRSQCAPFRGVAWFHKKVAPELFRFYPSQRGT